NHADFTLAQHAALWHRREKMAVSESKLSRVILRLGFPLKKKTIGAAERDEAEREAFRARISTLPVEDVVVIDEMGSHIGMIALYARAIRGCRAYDRAIRNRGKNLTISLRKSNKDVQ